MASQYSLKKWYNKLSNKDPNFHCGHRERLRQKFLDDKLAEYEKLELMLTYVVPRRDVRPLAHKLIEKFGSLPQILTTPLQDLLNFPGVGRNIAIFFKLVHRLIVDGYYDKITAAPIFHDINALKNYCRWSLVKKPFEEFHVLYLDSEYRLLKDCVHSLGSVHETEVNVRKIVSNALALNSTKIVLVHNHPTTDNGFSKTDLDTTETLKKLLKELDIDIYDHLVVSKFSITSVRDYNMFKDQILNPRSDTENQ